MSNGMDQSRTTTSNGSAATIKPHKRRAAAINPINPINAAQRLLGYKACKLVVLRDFVWVTLVLDTS
jgi:hypothetical protein